MGGLPGGRSVSHTIAYIQHSERMRERERWSDCVSLVNTSQQVFAVGSMESRTQCFQTRFHRSSLESRLGVGSFFLFRSRDLSLSLNF